MLGLEGPAHGAPRSGLSLELQKLSFIRAGGARKGRANFSRDTLSVFQGGRNKVLRAGWLKQQIFIFSRLWRLQVQGQGVCRVGVF